MKVSTVTPCVLVRAATWGCEMGTKENPGPFDCYTAAAADEPMFVLLGRDRHAPSLVEMWADVREAAGEDPAKVKEARECAAAMRAFRGRK